ncbi:MAG: hypothetical protein RLP09_16215 [Sandaracinaceae bacterium]
MRVLIWMCLLGCGSANPAPTQPAPEETEETEEAEVTEAAPLRCSVRHDAADPDMMGAEEDWVRDEAGRWVSHGAVSDGPALSARWTYGPEEIRFTVDFGEDRDEGVLRVSREGARVLVRQEAEGATPRSVVWTLDAGGRPDGFTVYEDDEWLEARRCVRDDAGRLVRVMTIEGPEEGAEAFAQVEIERDAAGRLITVREEGRMSRAELEAGTLRLHHEADGEVVGTSVADGPCAALLEPRCEPRSDALPPGLSTLP